MFIVTLFWFCAHDLNKASRDIENLTSKLFNESKYKLNVKMVIIDRTIERGKQYMPEIDKHENHFLVNSSLSRSHHDELLFIAKNFKSNYILPLTDDDEINYDGIKDFIDLLIINQEESIVIAVPPKESKFRRNYGELEPEIYYGFWEYQRKRYFNIAYYSAISRDCIINNCIYRFFI